MCLRHTHDLITTLGIQASCQESFAFVHMDSDLYESVYDSLEKVGRATPRLRVQALDVGCFFRLEGIQPVVQDSVFCA